jgi:hypothetical protein
MTAEKDTMTSFPEELLAMLKALREDDEEKRRRRKVEETDNGISYKDTRNKDETPEEEFERLSQTRDAIEY